jgi:hypothetical protein
MAACQDPTLRGTLTAVYGVHAVYSVSELGKARGAVVNALDLALPTYRVTLLSTVVLLILRRPPSLTSPYAVRSRTARPSLK